MTMRGYDAWITRGPPEYEERPPLRCASCGRFLKEEPDGGREYVRVRRCDGQPRVFEDTHDESVLAIIGEEYRGKKFTTAYPPDCGGKEPSHEQTGDGGEIHPNEVESYRHEPHFWADPYEWYAAAVRTCVCGATNEDAT